MVISGEGMLTSKINSQIREQQHNDKKTWWKRLWRNSNKNILRKKDFITSNQYNDGGVNYCTLKHHCILLRISLITTIANFKH